MGRTSWDRSCMRGPGAVVHGVPSVGFRFFNVYGPRQDPTFAV